MLCDKIGLRRLMEWCSDSNEYKDFGLCCFVFVERKGIISLLRSLVDSRRIDVILCRKLNIKKNVLVVRTVKY